MGVCSSGIRLPTLRGRPVKQTGRPLLILHEKLGISVSYAVYALESGSEGTKDALTPSPSPNNWERGESTALRGQRMVCLQKEWAVSARAEGRTEQEALLQAGRAGDRAALEQLLGLHKRSLYALCLGVLGHAEDAEDAVQETFLRALRGLSGFRHDASFRTWLLRIAVNLCLDWKASRRPTEPWNEEQFNAALHVPSAEAIALRHMQIRDALRSLLPRHRALILLKVREGWSVPEIAAALRWNEKRVENELSKARRALAEWRRRSLGEGEGR
jgi:RNA polymerase sigma-70 factor (ECF subfamily)